MVLFIKSKFPPFFFSVEERKWHPFQPRETSDSSEESEEDTEPCKPEEDSHMLAGEEIPVDVTERGAAAEKIEQNEESTWEKESYQI